MFSVPCYRSYRLVGGARNTDNDEERLSLERNIVKEKPAIVLFIAPAHIMAHREMEDFIVAYQGGVKQRKWQGAISSVYYDNGLSVHAFDAKMDTVNNWAQIGGARGNRVVLIAVDWEFWPEYTKHCANKIVGSENILGSYEKLFDNGLLERNRDGAV